MPSAPTMNLKTNTAVVSTKTNTLNKMSPEGLVDGKNIGHFYVEAETGVAHITRGNDSAFT